MADHLIRGGTVIDGTGAPRQRADVLIRDGRIAEVGLDLETRSDVDVIDATGLVVAPGFIDIHTHYDAQVFWDPWLTPSSSHGVTTVVAGNCGFSIAPCRPADHELMNHTLEHVEDMPLTSLRLGIPWDFETFPEYLDAVERRGTLLNFGGYVGHTAVRMYVMGGEDAYTRDATDAEIETMREVVADSVRGGALGFATSSALTHQGDNGRPVPSRLAGLREVSALARVLGEVGAGVGAFLPGEKISHEEMYALQPEVRRPFTWTALVTLPGRFHERLVTQHDEGTAAGAEVYPQVSVRPLVFQMTMAEPFSFQVVPIFAELLSEPPDVRIARYRDPAWRAEALAALEDNRRMRPQWQRIRVGESNTHPDLNGTTVATLAEQRGVSPLDAMIDIALADDLATRFHVTLANDDADAIADLLVHDGMILGLSDAGAHVSQLCDACFSTDLLGNWVRERAVLTLEQAVHKLTGEPARIFELPGRGVIAPGVAADIAVFDPETVAPGPLRRVQDFPGNAERLVADQPEGMVHVLVNGIPIRRDQAPVHDALEHRPGHVLRSGATTTGR